MSVYEITLLINGEEQSGDIVEHNGKQYRKVKRKAAVGELVAVVEDFAYGKIGEVHTVLEDDVEYDALVTDKATFMNHSRYNVLELVEQPGQSELDLIANLAKEVASLKKDLHRITGAVIDAQTDIADLEDRLDESEKDTEEVIGRINDLGDGAEASAVVPVAVIEKVIAELKYWRCKATDSCNRTHNEYTIGKAYGLDIAIDKFEEALRNG